MRQMKSETSVACTPATSVCTRTRSGRVTQAPVRYEPSETVEDDYEAEDYDSSDEMSESDFSESDDDDSGDDSDADEDGNLEGFVVEDDSDKSEESEDENDGQPPVPVPAARPSGKRAGRTPATAAGVGSSSKA